MLRRELVLPFLYRPILGAYSFRCHPSLLICYQMSCFDTLQVDPSLLAELNTALAGRPRQRDLVDAEVTDLIGGEGGGEMIGASAALGLLDDEDDEDMDLMDEDVS